MPVESVSSGDMITVQQFDTFVANWTNQEILKVAKRRFYGKDKIADILKQNNCIGIRIYQATNDKNEGTLVLIGVDNNGNDIKKDHSILEYGIP